MVLTRATRRLIFTILIAASWIGGPRAVAASGTPATAPATAEPADERAALERQLAANPGDRTLWLRLARLRGAAGAAAAAAEAYERALALGQDPRIMYNAACAHARAGQRDRAFAWLGKAAVSGAIPVTQLDQDEDLAGLRGDARFGALRDQARQAFEPCEFQAEARQFDFWLGAWEVRASGSQTVVGHSRIEKILSSCVLLENWTGTNGWAGKSFNLYDASEKRWHQTWVDQSGTLTHFIDGQWREGALRFRTEPREQGGQRTELRLTFYDLGPGKVRQHGQRSTDGGVTWQDQYDFIYERPGAHAAASTLETPQVDAAVHALGSEAHALGKEIGHRERAHRARGVTQINLVTRVGDGPGENQLTPLQVGQRETRGVEAHVGEGRGVHERGSSARPWAPSARRFAACAKRVAAASRP